MWPVNTAEKWPVVLFIEGVGVGGEKKSDIYGQSFCLRQCTNHDDEHSYFILTITYPEVITSALQKTQLEVERLLVQGHITAGAGV